MGSASVEDVRTRGEGAHAQRVYTGGGHAQCGVFGTARGDFAGRWHWVDRGCRRLSCHVWVVWRVFLRGMLHAACVAHR